MDLEERAEGVSGEGKEAQIRGRATQLVKERKCRIVWVGRWLGSDRDMGWWRMGSEREQANERTNERTNAQTNEQMMDVLPLAKTCSNRAH
ncbi:Protein of unknown function [Pyronema omphalodes CBS 100304]|uniref:Uncharacterized protein n=1 Tax=Pyronema omphalodes (strain CBS 100304) TaxID=1076935 RepID=U4L132_PYROM|nr:Protein of unknown function [Pyronema omphalodes CBS 100304]